MLNFEENIFFLNKIYLLKYIPGDKKFIEWNSCFLYKKNIKNIIHKLFVKNY